MNFILRKLFDIREDEVFRAFLMFSYIFLVIASLLIVKPVRNSLFLTTFGIAQLPYVFILVALTSAIVISIYSKFANKVRLNLLILNTTLFSLSNLFIFWLLLHFNYQGYWFIYLFYVWVAIFGVISTTQFWLLANFVFNVREAKRLFSFIGAGAISGGIFGGYLTNYLAPVFGTENLIFFSISFLFICTLILGVVWKKSARYNYKERILLQKRVKQASEHAGNPIRLIFNSRHLIYLASIMGIGVIVANLVDYQFSAVASALITDKDKLTAFFGFWLSNLSIASLLFQLFLTRRILKTFGVGTSLFFLPIGLMIGAITILFSPSLWSTILIKVSDGSLKQSINKAGVELLALPIPAHVKTQVKAFIDVFIRNLATGIGGILLILFTVGLNFSFPQISLVMIFLIVVWLILIVRAKGEYINSFRIAIEKRTINLEDQSVNLEDASLIESLIKVFDGNNERQILYCLQLVGNVKIDQLIPLFKKLINHPSGEVKVQVLKMVRQYQNMDLVFEASELIEDKDQNVQIEAMRYLCHHSLDKMDTIKKFLSHENFRVQSKAVVCVAIEGNEDPNFRKMFNLKELFDERMEKFRQVKDQDQIKLMSMDGARVVGIANDPELYPYLHILLSDQSLEVLEEAVSAAGKTRAIEFIPILIKHLNTKLVRKTARVALSEYGDDVIDFLVEHLNDQNEIRNIRSSIPKVLALISSQMSVDALIKNLELNDLLLRYEIIKALSNIKTNFPMLKFDENYIGEKILDEIKNYYTFLTLLYNQSSTGLDSEDLDSNGARRARKLLIKALEEKLEENLERIFRLLGLKYLPKEMLDAYHGILSNKKDLQANAIEFLDNILDFNLKKFIIPIVESSSIDSLIIKTKELLDLNVPSEFDCLVSLISGNDNWLKVCSVFLVAELRTEKCISVIGKLVNDTDPVVKETAEYALRKFEIMKN